MTPSLPGEKKNSRTRRTHAAACGIMCRRSPALTTDRFTVQSVGPVFADREERAWSIPKGMVEPDEDAVCTARRAFDQEVGQRPPPPPYLDRGSMGLASGKRSHVFAAEGDVEPVALQSNTFTMQQPPSSGRLATFPEVNQGPWCEPELARRTLRPAQAPQVARLLEQRSAGQVVDEQVSPPYREAATDP